MSQLSLKNRPPIPLIELPVDRSAGPALKREVGKYRPKSIFHGSRTAVGPCGPPRRVSHPRRFCHYPAVQSNSSVPPQSVIPNRLQFPRVADMKMVEQASILDRRVTSTACEMETVVVGLCVLPQNSEGRISLVACPSSDSTPGLLRKLYHSKSRSEEPVAVNLRQNRGKLLPHFQKTCSP
jgi:hypothetical protein